MPQHRRFRLLLLLIVSGLSCCFHGASLDSQWPTIDSDSAPELVSTPAQFVAALRNEAVKTIILGEDLLMSKERWPEETIRVGRNLTIDGRQHFFNFTRVRDRVLLDPGVHLSLRSVDLAGSSSGSFFNFVQESPGAFVWIRDGTFKCYVCPPARRFHAMVSSQPRPLGFPGEQATAFSVLPVCFRSKCYPLAMMVHEFAVDMYPISYGNQQLRAKFTALKWNLTWACDTVMSDECVLSKGYDACRTQLLEAQARGFTHAYDRRTYEAYVRCAVALCVVLLSVVVWAVSRALRTHRAHKGKDCSSTNSLPLDWPPGPDPSNSGFSSASGDLKDAIKLDSILGSGSYGCVYSGTWRDTRVAVKVVPHGASNAALVAREVAIGQRVEHPNVVRTLHQMTLPLRMLDLTEMRSPGRLVSPVVVPHVATSSGLSSSKASGGSDGTQLCSLSQEQSTWIVQELCDLGTLTHHLKKLQLSQAPAGGGAPPMDLIMSYALDVALGMACLHEQGICHGDLKARNVLVKTDAAAARGNVAKVADFGVSRQLDGDRSHLSTKSLGTISHMPPELLENGKLTRECDVYSFGIMLCELCTGHIAFRDLNAGQVMHKVSIGERPPFPPRVPPAIVTLAHDCWAQDPARRPTFVAIADRLKGMLRADGSACETPGPAEREGALSSEGGVDPVDR